MLVILETSATTRETAQQSGAASTRPIHLSHPLEIASGAHEKDGFVEENDFGEGSLLVGFGSTCCTLSVR